MPVNRETLLDILESWSPEKSLQSQIIPRLEANKITLYREFANVITGVRRCGKSTLLHQLIKTNHIPSKRVVFVNFDDPRLIQYLDHQLLDRILELTVGRSRRSRTFFFDEIQHVENWQRWINTALELHREHTFVITGSNSKLLSGELSTSLTGRHLTTELFPFDYAEFRKMNPQGSIRGYLKRGGFPAAIEIKEPERLLQQYFHDIIEKDVRERVSARSSRPLKAVAQMVFESVGSETSLRRIGGALGLSPDTVNTYLGACEDAYLIFSCPYFAYSEAKRTRRNRKYYAIDTALRRSVSTRVGVDDGKDFENLVYLTLRRKTKEVYYWKGKAEVDFLVNTQNALTPIQVTWGKPKERHEKGLKEFYEQFPHAAEAIYVTPQTYEDLITLEL